MSETSGRQRLFAAALGIRGAESMTSEELSAEIDAEKSRRQSPPNNEQLRIADRWGVDLSTTRTAGAATGRLWDAALARVYVLSIVRKICSADWRFHADCPVPETWINSTAIQLGQDATRAEIVRAMDNSMSGTMGDAWIRFGKRQAQSAAFKFVEQAARAQLDIDTLARSKRHRKSTRRNDKSGCLLTVAAIFAIAVSTVLTTLGN